MTSIRLSQTLSRPAAAAESSEQLRRALNVAVAAVGLLIMAPLMAVIAVLIKVTSRGPVFFKHTRVGLDRRGGGRLAPDNRRADDCGGKPFTIYKFRTMVPNGDPNHQVWAQPNDPRVTRIGRILRLYRLDELPQLINVLRGDMDVVGPRPEQPAIFAQLRQQVDRYQERQRVRPGITGLAQVSQRYDSSVDDVRSKVQFDLDYIARQSFFEDLKIMLRTVPVVIGKRGGW